jgi:ribonuclease Z
VSDLSLTFLGTGGSVPTARRATACFLVRREGDRLLFDCGEGAQRQMLQSTGLLDLDEIYLTHYHADHYLGIPGLVKTYDLHDRRRRLRVYGPRGLRDLFSALRRIFGRTRFDIELIELEPGDSVDHEGYRVEAVPVEHRVHALGYVLVEEPRAGRFDPERAAQLGVASGPDFGRLQKGESVPGESGTVGPADVMGDPRPGRKIVISGDTRACDTIEAAARGAQLLVHDASFCDAELERAADTGHATARQAAALARSAEVGLLALVHVSTRYRIADVLIEAREEFPAAEAPRDFDLVEIPLPERGDPRLVQGGARVESRSPAVEVG